MLKNIAKLHNEIILSRIRFLRRSLTVVSDGQESPSVQNPQIASSLISSYLTKHEQKPLDILPISDAKRSAAQVRLTFTDKEDNTRTNDEEIISAFKVYEKSGNIEAAMELCIRLQTYKILPHPKALTSLINILETIDTSMVHEIYLNILACMHRQKMEPVNSLVGLLTGKIRYIKDSFLRKAFYEEAEAYIKENPRYSHFLPVLERDYAVSLLNDGNLEGTYTSFQKLDHEQKQKFPVNRLLYVLLCKGDGLEQSLSICEEMSDEISTENWILILQKCIDLGHSFDVLKLWELYFKNNVSYISRNLASAMIPLIGRRGRTDIILMLLRQLQTSKNILEPKDAENLIAAICIPEIRGDVDKCIEYCIQILFYQPNVDIRVLHNFARLLADAAIIPSNMPAVLFNVINEVESFLSTIDKSIADSSKRVRTIVMNCTLMAQAYEGYENSPTFVSYIMFKRKGFVEDQFTFELLVSAARKEGDAKKLTYEIYKHFTETLKVEPNLRIFKEILAAQMTGKNYGSAIFFFLEMEKRNIVLDKELDDYVREKFRGVEQSLYDHLMSGEESLRDPVIEHFGHFPPDSVLEESEDRRPDQNQYFYGNDLKYATRLRNSLENIESD